MYLSRGHAVFWRADQQFGDEIDAGVGDFFPVIVRKHVLWMTKQSELYFKNNGKQMNILFFVLSLTHLTFNNAFEQISLIFTPKWRIATHQNICQNTFYYYFQHEKFLKF